MIMPIYFIIPSQSNINASLDDRSSLVFSISSKIGEDAITQRFRGQKFIELQTQIRILMFTIENAESAISDFNQTRAQFLEIFTRGQQWRRAWLGK